MRRVSEFKKRINRVFIPVRNVIPVELYMSENKQKKRILNFVLSLNSRKKILIGEKRERVSSKPSVMLRNVLKLRKLGAALEISLPHPPQKILTTNSVPTALESSTLMLLRGTSPGARTSILDPLKQGRGGDRRPSFYLSLLYTCI